MEVQGRNAARRGERLGRVGLVLLGVLLALAVLELGLRVAAGWVGPRAGPLAWGRETVLTLGDSHTYGVFFPAGQSYPARLAARLDARSAGGFRVVNLGLPGTNSSEVATRLPAWLDAHAPRHVVLCVGVNNIWNRSDAGRVGGEPARVAFWERLRVVRLARLLQLRFADDPDPDPDTARPELERSVIGRGDVAVEFRDRETGELVIRHEGNFRAKRSQSEALSLLRRDLAHVHALLEARGVQLVLLTYAEHPVEGRMSAAQRNHAEVNRVLRGFAAERDLALVDSAPRIRARLAAGAATVDYFHPDGFHPTPAGYDAIAEAVAELLAGEGADPAEAP